MKQLTITILHLLTFGAAYAQATNKIDSVGRVGIGTTTPPLDLSVVSTASNFAAQIKNTSVYGGGLNIAGGSSTIGALVVNDYTVTGPNNFVVYGSGRTLINNSLTATDISVGNTPATSAASSYEILTRNPSSGNIEKVPFGNYILNQSSVQTASSFNISGNGFIGGNAGIGTTTPTEKLSVNGNVVTNGNMYAKKVVVTQTPPFPDYVFNPDYRLMPLSEVARFIHANKHLPEVPSAKEIAEKGVNIGDNQALLLKKIEELTLYVIELTKQNQKQQKQINRLLGRKK